MNYKNILFIDDDPDDMELAVSALKLVSLEINYSVEYSARAALPKLVSKELVPDLIFLDLNMPIMTGLQFLSEFKKAQDLKNIPVIIFSTTSNPLAVEAALDLGAKSFLTKPLQFSELIDLFRKIIL